MNKSLHEIKEKLLAEIDEIAKKKEINAGDLEALQKLTSTIKNINKIVMFEVEGGGVQSGGWEERETYSAGGSRGSRGREGFSRGGKREICERLEEMLDNATDREREAIRRCVDALKDMR